MRNLRAATTAIFLALITIGTAEARPLSAFAIPTTVRPADGAEFCTNASGHRVHRPVQTEQLPPGAAAQCADGSYRSVSTAAARARIMEA